MKKIAILTCEVSYDRYEDSKTVILDSMWYEVSDEEAAYIKKNVHRLNNYPTEYRVVEYVEPTELPSLMERLKQLAAADEAKKKKAEEARARAQAKAKESELERKRKRLMKLKKELGEA